MENKLCKFMYLQVSQKFANIPKTESQVTFNVAV